MGILISYETDERRMTFYARFYGPYESRKFRPKYSSVIWAIDTFGWKIPLSSLLAFVCFDSFVFFFVGFWPVFETRHLNTVGNFCPYSITRECMTLSHKTPRNRAHTRINDICVLEFIRSFVLVTQIIYQIVPYACLRDTLETFYLSGLL